LVNVNCYAKFYVRKWQRNIKFIDDTIILIGIYFLCIFGRSNAFGNEQSLDLNKKNPCFEI